MANFRGRLLIGNDGEPRDRVVGFETEYALFGNLSDHYSDTRSAEELVTKGITYKLDGEYQNNGDRIYIDIGHHPELSTAEDINFSDATNRLLAGHVTMAKMCNFVVEQINSKEKKIERIALASNTCDIKGNSWGSHENYLAPRSLEPESYVGVLATHNATRIVWSGAGHVLPEDRGKSYTLCLSEKAGYIHEIANWDTVKSRPLVNLRDEALADISLYRRIHNVSGESIFSPFANALRLASASIILRACELGIVFDDLMPSNPVTAMKRVSKDPSLKTKIELINGKKVTALDLQMAIAERSLEAAEVSDYLTEQERQWGNEWLVILDNLKTDPNKCVDRVDWVLKKHFIERKIKEVKEDKNEEDDNQAIGMLALAESFGYHQLLPSEGPGMQFLRKGRFKNSPSIDILENGVALPHTRAALRSRALMMLTAADAIIIKGDWCYIVATVNDKIWRFTMANPYQWGNKDQDHAL